MLSKEQKLLLAQLVRDNKAVVFEPFSSKVTKKAKQVKQEAWETIRTQLNGVGANIGMEWNGMIYLMSKTWEVFSQSSEPEAHVKNARQMAGIISH